VHGVHERHAAEKIRVPLGYGVILLDEGGIERAEHHAGLDGVGAEEHLIREDETGKEQDGQDKQQTDRKVSPEPFSGLRAQTAGFSTRGLTCLLGFLFFHASIPKA